MQFPFATRINVTSGHKQLTQWKRCRPRNLCSHPEKLQGQTLLSANEGYGTKVCMPSYSPLLKWIKGRFDIT